MQTILLVFPWMAASLCRLPDGCHCWRPGRVKSRNVANHIVEEALAQRRGVQALRIVAAASRAALREGEGGGDAVQRQAGALGEIRSAARRRSGAAH